MGFLATVSGFEKSKTCNLFRGKHEVYDRLLTASQIDFQ
jgi:hypothetical protein